MTVSRRSALAAVAAAAAATLPVPGRAGTGPARAPLFEGMGAYRVDDASPSALARRYVAQGMVLAWGFNAAEAARSFAGALQADAGCAAAAWGLAWSLGPTLNADMAAADAPRVHEMLARARALRGGAPPRWRDLIDALATRHATADRVDEEAYAQRMLALTTRHRHDADVATLAAEALMALHPYDWWQGPARTPQPWTPAIERALQRALALDPRHPGANHAWVHLMETSAHPQRALAQADRLRTLVPGSGHLLHMPAHIDMRLGRYAAATRANELAIAADRRYLAQVDAQGAYRVGYVAHNHHFLYASAAMQGRSAQAIAAADEAFGAACGPRRGDAGGASPGTLQHLQALPLLARVRFGHWQELLTGVAPPEGDTPYALALWHYARGTAQARTGRAAAAASSLDALSQLRDDPALATLRIKGVHAARTIVELARLTLQADLQWLAGDTARALANLHEGVRLEDRLEADEPHVWLAPTRHALGAALLRARRPAQALPVFRQDLHHYPDNGWSLLGVMQAQRALHQSAAAAHTAKRLATAWRDADIALASPRL